MNQLLGGLISETNIDLTENGAVKHITTMSSVLDMFAMGGAYRNRTDNECIMLFSNAYDENPEYALKCLFYLRDILEGQGERRFFRVCINWLAQKHPQDVIKNLEFIPALGRWDDLYALVDTPVENAMFAFMYKQLLLDLDSKTPSLLAKWLKSENASSKETIELARKTMKAFFITPRIYRKILSTLRQRINVLERLMSAGKWDEIEFDKIPSVAGMKYKNAFARHDVERIKSQSYADFAKSDASVNAKALTPLDIARKSFCYNRLTETDILMLQKYWDNLTDFYDGKTENALCMVDVSGSMYGTPMEAAVAMGTYIAERSGGAFKNYYMTFSDEPTLMRCSGKNIVEKMYNVHASDWGGSTNIEGAFDIMLDVAKKKHLSQEDMPDRFYIFTDMEFNEATMVMNYDEDGRYRHISVNKDTLIEGIEKKWRASGYIMPDIIFWNLNARTQNIPAIGSGYSYISGFSMSMIPQVLSGKTGYELMMEKLDTPRYASIKTAE